MSNKTPQSRELTPAIIRGTEALKRSLGAESPLVVSLLGLSERLEHRRLQLAILGQFKRGKSTFINALLGASVLPTGVIPLTAIATFIAWRPRPLVRIHFKDNKPVEEYSVSDINEIRDLLFRFVAQEVNPENRLGVARVELFYPAALLRNGIVLIDTPGVGSTLQHHTDAALQVLPECDAALFVLSVDPPITEIEVEYLRRVRSRAARVFFILNKADYVPQDERARVVEFLHKVLSERSLLDSVGSISCVSARDGLAAREASDSPKLQESGIADLESHLVRHLESEKAQWLEAGVRTRVIEILSEATAEVALRRGWSAPGTAARLMTPTAFWPP
jgi:GTP-binding protein EngB required for normal cell division